MVGIGKKCDSYYELESGQSINESEVCKCGGELTILRILMITMSPLAVMMPKRHFRRKII